MIPSEQEKKEYAESIKMLENKKKKHLESIEHGTKVGIEYKLALDRMKDNNKNMLLFFHMDGCPGCKVYDYLMKYNDEIKYIIDSKYELILINGQKTRTELIQKYGIYNYPSLIMLDKNEKKIKQNIGCEIDGGVENNLINWLRI